jgi:hypothetical protein
MNEKGWSQGIDYYLLLAAEWWCRGSALAQVR